MTVTVTAAPQPANIPPRIQLTVTGTTEKSTTVTRLNGDGTTVPVRTSDGGPLVLSGTTTLYDYEAPFGPAVSYSSLESPAAVSTQVALAVSQVWLIHPGVPALSMSLNLRPGSLLDETLTVKQGIFYPMGRTNPVIISDGSRKGSQSQLVVTTETLDELQELRALVSDAGTLLLNVPTSMGVGFDTNYIGVGDLKVTRWTDVVIDSNRDVTLPFYVVDRPAGGSQAQRTYVDLLSFASYQALRAAYESYTQLLAGP